MSIKEQEILDYISKHRIPPEYYSTDLNKIATTVMIELVKANYADFLLLRDDVVSKWWGHKVNEARRVIEKKKERIRLYDIKIKAWERLTVEERATLGIKKPIKPRNYSVDE